MSWSHLLGHTDRIAAFRQIIARQRLAHAYLFVGPAGVGKRMFARELAKALLCESKAKTSLDACDHCDACSLVDAGTHPDLFQIAKPEDVNEFPIDVMREFLRDFSLKPARGHGKIGIIDDADSFRDPAEKYPAANCFLKTLEEPAAGSLFLLIGTSIDLQIPTIRSRCQMVRFAPLPEEPMRTLLQQQGIDDPVMLARLIRLSGGSPGQALALADEALWQFRATLLQAFAKPKVESVALGKAFVEFAEDAGKETALQRRRASQILRLLIESFTDILRIQAGAPARSVESAELPTLTALAQRADAEKIHAILERCLETETHLGRYVQITLVLEGLMDAIGQLLEHAGPLPVRYQGFSA